MNRTELRCLMRIGFLIATASGFGIGMLIGRMGGGLEWAPLGFLGALTVYIAYLFILGKLSK